MTKEEQIEEMTSICYVSICHQIGGGDFVQAGDRRAAGEICAEELHESGYRKADEVRKETAQEIFDRLQLEKTVFVDDYGNKTFAVLTKEIEEIAVYYGVGVEDERK